MGNVVRGRRRVFLSAPDLRKERGRRDAQAGRVNRIAKLNRKLVMLCAAEVGWLCFYVLSSRDMSMIS